MRSRKNKAHCQVTETLEIRKVLAANITASLSGGVLRIEGTERADAIYVLQSDSSSRSISVGSTPGAKNYGSFSGTAVTRIEIVALGGNDVINLEGVGGAHRVKVNTTIWGGGGNDVLKGGQGTDHLHGGSGNDQLFGNDGIDWLYGESGDDDLNGGNGADHLDGGTGINTLR